MTTTAKAYEQPTAIIAQPVNLIAEDGTTLFSGALPIEPRRWPLVIIHDGDVFIATQAAIAPAAIIYRRTRAWHSDGLLQPAGQVLS